MQIGPKNPDDRPTPYEVEQKLMDRHLAHGEKGHVGWRCLQCAFNSPVAVPVYTEAQLVDTLQNKLLEWNKLCDMMRQNHGNECQLGIVLKDCKKGHWPLPEEPTLPIERHHLE